MRIINKKFIYQFITAIRNVFGGKKTIAFYAPLQFHSEHLLPVVKKLAKENRVNIILIGNFEVQPQLDARYFESVSQLPITTRIDLFIATEFGPTPWWTACPTVYFGHGIGPKLNYASKSHLQEYDYSFVSCEPTHQAQAKLDVKLVKVGLPITDISRVTKSDVCKKYGLDINKKIIVYAPSWSADSYVISPIFDILKSLTRLTNCNVILSPHPFLRDRKRCNDIDYFQDLPANILLNDAHNGFSTLDLAAVSDGIISDISSVFFEAMAMGVLGIFDGNTEIYKVSGSNYLIDDIMQACYTLNVNDDCSDSLQQALDRPLKMAEQQRFIQGYVYNQGKATDVFIQKVNEILKEN